MGTFTDSLKAIAVILRSIRQPMSWKSILTYTVFIFITSGVWITTKKLETIINRQVLLEQKIDRITPKEIFAEQFSVEYINIDGKIHDKLTELHLNNGVGWTLLIGIHNGALVGPFHLRKVSVLDERITGHRASLLKEIQNMPIVVFKHDLNAYWGVTDALFARKTEDLPDNTSEKRELQRVGIYYEMFKPLYIDNLSVPFAFFTVYLTKEEYEQFNEEELKEMQRRIFDTARTIEYEFQRMYNLQTSGVTN